MADIFGRPNSGYGGAYNSSLAKMTILAGGTDITAQLLVENAGLNYTQQLSRIFELGSNLTYLVVGNTLGRGQLGATLGPKGSNDALSSLGDPCNDTSLSFDFGGESRGRCTTADILRIAHGVVATNYGFQVQSGDMLIREQLAFEFTDLTTG